VKDDEQWVTQLLKPYKSEDGSRNKKAVIYLDENNSRTFQKTTVSIMDAILKKPKAGKPNRRF
jgi:hypothetical protein